MILILKKKFKDYARLTGSYKTLIALLFIYTAFGYPEFFILPLLYVFFVTFLTLYPLPYYYTLTFISVILICFFIIWVIPSYRRIKKEYLALKLSKEMSDKDKITFFIKSIYDNLKQLLIYAASLFVTGHILFQIVFVVSKLYKFVHNEIPLDY